MGIESGGSRESREPKQEFESTSKESLEYQRRIAEGERLRAAKKEREEVMERDAEGQIAGLGPDELRSAESFVKGQLNKMTKTSENAAEYEALQARYKVIRSKLQT